MNIALRSACDDDVAFARNLYFETMREIIDRLFGWDKGREEKNFAGFFKLDEVRIITADDQDVGWIQEQISEHSINLGSFYVVPAMQGRGIGTEVLRMLLERAARESKAMTLGVVKINPARQFYEKRGFRATHEDEYKGLYECIPYLVSAAKLGAAPPFSSVETSRLHSSSLTRELSILGADDLPPAAALQPCIGPGEAARHGLVAFVFPCRGLAAIDHGHIVAVAGRVETDSGAEQPAICLGLALVGVHSQYVALRVARTVARRGSLKVIGQDLGFDLVEVAAALRPLPLRIDDVFRRRIVGRRPVRMLGERTASERAQTQDQLCEAVRHRFSL